MEENAQDALYTPLDPAKREIRLLEILVDLPDGDAAVSCNMTVASLDDEPLYVALSLHAWDDMSTTQTIVINGIEKRVASNLAMVLSRFRRMKDIPEPSGKARFWADAVCIDQDSIPEKSYHASLVGDLYSSTVFVLSWLGTAECVPTAVEALNIMYQHGSNFKPPSVEEIHTESARRKPFVGFRTLERALDEPPHIYRGVLNTHRRWQAVHDFLAMPFWSDVWTFLETVCSGPGGAHVFIGPGGVFFDEYKLKGALDHLLYLSTGVALPERPDFVSESWWARLEALKRVSNAVWRLNNLFERKKLIREENGGLRAWYCFHYMFTQVLQAKDPRDFYYALSGAAGLRIKADYGPGKEVHRVGVDFVRAWLDVHQHSRFAPVFLHYALGREDAQRHKIPSWAPRIDFSSSTSFHHRLYGPEFSAFASLGLFEPLSEQDRAHPTLSPDKRTLRVLGMRITTITCADHRPTEDFYKSGAMGVYLVEFIKRHTTTYVTGIPAAKALLAVIETQVDGYYEGLKACSVIYTLLKIFLEPSAQGLESTTIWHELMISVSNEAGGDRSLVETFSQEASQQHVGEFFDILAAHEARTRPCRIIETKDGYLGLAPEGVEANDLVCILDYFQYPVILRQTANGFLLVGVCFILGLMKGEAAQKWGGDKLQPEVFAIS